MRIPLLNIYVMTEATLEAAIKKTVEDTLKFSSKQVGVLLKENHRLVQGKPKKKLSFRRRVVNEDSP